ncbi:MAG: hypothetical protein Q9225_002303 [Loekoesia sp. 1 TL-2023]
MFAKPSLPRQPKPWSVNNFKPPRATPRTKYKDTGHRAFLPSSKLFALIVLMEHTSVEDFQKFHARYASAQSSKSTSRPASLRPQDTPIQSIEHDYDDAASLSGSARHSSGQEEAVFDPPLSHHSSPRTSHHSDENESISSFFSQSRDPSFPPEHQPSSPYTPLKMRSPFRNPSSVRALQMDTTPPPFIPSSSRHGTPRSVRSSYRGSRTSPNKMSPTKKSNLKKEYPLVLLHVTLLPIPQTYSVEVMEQVLPSYILENWKILREKATDTVLERGVLIPHPKEDYDLMEERLLESLDLKTPRILKCGHFHLDPDEEADAAGSDAEDFDNEDDDADICADCGRRVRDGRYGSGTGSRRWDIKVYAANGLMRAGAWSAAWREMERVDVEITPWMDEEVKRELALRAEEERKHAALLQEEAVRREDQRPTMDEERMREIYGDDMPAYVNEKEERPPSPLLTQSVNRQQNKMPLQDLLKNYLIAAAQDRKNIAISVLGIFVLYLSMATKPAPRTPPVASYQTIVPSSSNPISASADLPSISTSVIPSLEPSLITKQPSITTQPDIPSMSQAPQEDDIEVPSSAESWTSNEDSTDAIEARFEFAGERRP